MTISYSFDDSEGLGSRAWEWFKSFASNAGKFIRSRLKKWFDILVWIGLLLLVFRVSWLLVPAVLVVAYLYLRKR